MLHFLKEIENNTDLRMTALQDLVNARREYTEHGHRKDGGPFHGGPNPPKGYLQKLDRAINRLKKDLRERRELRRKRELQETSSGGQW